MAPQILRALQLKELGRYADAERALRDALAQEPNDDFALHHLALCQFHQDGREREALATIDDAIGISPNDADHHVVRSFILSHCNRAADGLRAAQTARELDPMHGGAFTAEAQAYIQMEKWPLAERSARQALAIDADNSSAANQLAHSLRLQNKLGENASHLAGMLARDPEDPYTHANAGWAALQCGERRVAEEHFREALRLDPEFESAREGLLSSFRARSPLYRGYLSYCFYMQRLGKGTRWAVILGLYFGSRIAARMGGGLGLAILALYFLFVLWIWVSRPVGNCILLFDRFARYALRRGEKIEAIAVTGAIAVGLAALGIGFFRPADHWFTLGIGGIAVAFPLAMIFTNPSRAGRGIFGACASLALAGTVAMLAAQFLPIIPKAGAAALFGLGCFACLLCTWLGNVPALRRG